MRTSSPKEENKAAVPAREAACFIARRLNEAGHRALLAGGCVRDELLGIEPSDYDVATSAAPEQVRALFPKTLAVGAQFGVVMVIEGGARIEVATFRSEGAYLDGRRPSEVRFADERADAMRRDFTVNGLFKDPLSGEILDYVGGRKDIEARLIRAIGDPLERFQEDRLRMLRAVRLAAQLDFEIESRTFAAIRRMSERITDVSAERIRDEILRILTGPAPRKGFELMLRTGLLKVVLPEVAAMVGVAQPPEFHPEGDVWTHTMMMLELARSPSATLALAVLLHDVGKPATISLPDDPEATGKRDRIRFPEHESVGAAMAAEICRRMRLPNETVERVAALVAGHMKFKDMERMRQATLKRFIFRDDFDDLLELHRLDCLASHGDLSAFDFALRKRDELRETPRPAPLLTGRDLIEAGYKPGPLFGKILAEIEDMQLDGKLSTREDAMEHVKARWPAQEDRTEKQPGQ
jgi:poly(A) polymerase